MKLSRTVELALHATLQLAQARSDMPVPCSQLAAGGVISERFLLQVLRNLVNHGILASRRGVVGGFRLSRPSGEISLLDLIEAVEGPITTAQPKLQLLPDHVSSMVGATVDRATRLLRTELDSLKMSQLLLASTDVPDAGP